MQDLCTSKRLADQKVPKYEFVFLLVVWYEQYLEVVPDMTTQSFIRCFKHFTARRGVLIRII